MSPDALADQDSNSACGHMVPTKGKSGADKLTFAAQTHYRRPESKALADSCLNARSELA